MMWCCFGERPALDSSPVSLCSRLLALAACWLPSMPMSTCEVATVRLAQGSTVGGRFRKDPGVCGNAGTAFPRILDSVLCGLTA